MWWSMPEAGSEHSTGTPVRTLAVAGTMGGRQRTVLTLVPIAAVQPNASQPRKHFDEAKIAELGASIRARGLLQPIVVRRTAQGFELLAGERRLRAAQVAGIERLPAVVREGDDPLEIALIENVQREDLSPLEEAEALAMLVERHGYSHREIAELLGKSRPYVSNTLALTRLPEPVKSDIHREGGALSRELLMSVAREEDPDAAVALWRRLKLDLLTVRSFRAERAGERLERSALREVLTAARRLNRALGRLGTEDVAPVEARRLGRVLRRSERLIRKRLTAIAGAPARPS